VVDKNEYNDEDKCDGLAYNYYCDTSPKADDENLKCCEEEVGVHDQDCRQLPICRMTIVGLRL
jgi:hypothetical protein